MKLLFPRPINAWLLAFVSLTAVGLASIAPMVRSSAQNPPTTYTITDLGTLGGMQSKAFGINNCGQVAGQSAPTGTNPVHPFFWRDLNGDGGSDPGEMLDIGTLGTASSGTATVANNSGYVVGYSPANGSSNRAFMWHDDNGNNASDPGEMKELLPVGRVGAGEDINDNGRVVGWLLTSASDGGTGGFEAFIWENNSFQIVNGDATHGSLQAFAINNAGTIVGVNSDTVGGFVLRSGVFTDIGLSGQKSVAYAVSEGDHVVGKAGDSSGSDPTLAFIWTDAGPTPGLKHLGTLTGKTSSTAYNVAIVNGLVQVVGTSSNNDSDERAFVWQDADGDGQGANDPNEMKDLTTLISPADPTWTVLQQARSINSSGQIVGYGLKSNGETHAFLLTPPSGPPSACLPIVNVSVSPSAVNEDAVGSLTYTFTRSIVTASPLTVNFSVGGTADASTDYGQTGAASFTPPTGTVTFAGGSATATVTVDPTTDSVVEPNETVVLTTTAGTGYMVGTPSAATGTINNDDTNVSVSVAPASVSEDGADNLVYTLTRTGLPNAITVNFSLTGSTASFGTDYTHACTSCSVTASGGTINFASNETSRTITIDPTTDTTDESNETVVVNLTAGMGYTAGAPSSATSTITDDDGSPTISINNVNLAEGNSGSAALVFTVSLSNPSSSQVMVNYATAAGTTNPATGGTLCSTAGTDFINTPGTLTFAPSEVSKQVTVPVCGDTSVESDETFFVNLSGNTNSDLPANTKGTGTITNDDTDIIVTLSPLTVAESGAPNLVYTFTRNGVTTGALTANFSVEGTATVNTDYSVSGAASFDPINRTGTIAFGAGETSKQVTVDPTPDSVLENDETVKVTVTTGSGYIVGSPNATEGTITPDAPIVFAEAGTENNPIPNAAAVDSVTFARGPFRLTNDLNFSSDRLTRVILITSTLGMTRANLSTHPGLLTVNIAGYASPLPIEDVGTITGIAGLDASFIIVRLPANLPNAFPGPTNLTLTVKMGSATSNATLLSISP